MGSRTFYGLLGALLALAIIVIAVGLMLNNTSVDETFSNIERAQQTATAVAKSTLPVTLPSATAEPTTSASNSVSAALLLPYDELDLLGSHTLSSELVSSGPITTTTISTVWETNIDTALRRVVVTITEASAANTLTFVTETIYLADTAYQRQDDGPWTMRSTTMTELDTYARDWLGGYDTELLDCPLTLVGRETLQGIQVNRYAVSPDCIKEIESGAVLWTVEASLWATESEGLIIQASIYLEGVDSEGQPFGYEIDAEVQSIGVNPAITVPTL